MKHTVFFSGLALFLVGGGLLALGFNDTVQEKFHALISQEEQNEVNPQNENNTIVFATDNPIEAKLKFTFYYDFTCPYCNSFLANTFIPLSQKYSNDLSFEILPYTLSASGESFEQAKNFLCVSQIQPSVQAIETINSLKQRNEEAKDDVERETQTLVQAMGLNLQDSGKFLSCITNDAELEKSLQEIKENAKEKGVRGTPSFLIGEKLFERNQSIQKVEFEIIDILSQ